jgi:hypothetical protein
MISQVIKGLVSHQLAGRLDSSCKSEAAELCCGHDVCYEGQQAQLPLLVVKGTVLFVVHLKVDYSWTSGLLQSN